MNICRTLYTYVNTYADGLKVRIIRSPDLHTPLFLVFYLIHEVLRNNFFLSKDFSLFSLLNTKRKFELVFKSASVASF